MEKLVEKEGKLHLFGKVMIDEERFFVLLNKIRVALPEDLRRAMEITRQGERVMEQAQQRAREVIERAKQEAAKLVSQDEIVRRAEEEARRIMAKAEEQARRIRREAEGYAQEARRAADDYAREVLNRIKGVLNRTISTIDEGLRELVPREGQGKEGESER